jgi:hypothetical protein
VILGASNGVQWDALLVISGGKLTYWAKASFPTAPAGAVIPAGRDWVHVACAVSSTTAQLYVQGIPVGSVSLGAGLTFNSASVWYVGDSFAGGAPLKGSIADVRIHDTARAASYWRDRVR